MAYYDANKTGMLVSRIMSDVEGVRNLHRHRPGGVCGRHLMAMLLAGHPAVYSPVLTGLALLFIAIFALTLRSAFRNIRPIFRERGKINADVTGRLTERFPACVW